MCHPVEPVTGRGTCVKGTPGCQDQHEYAGHPPIPEGWAVRDPEAERALVLASARADLAEHAARLNAFADARSYPGPVRLAKDGSARDLVREAREELADCRNYLVWEHARRVAHGANEGELLEVRVALGQLVRVWRTVDGLAPESDD